MSKGHDLGHTQCFLTQRHAYCRKRRGFTIYREYCEPESGKRGSCLARSS
jgi:hypothetical protein